MSELTETPTAATGPRTPEGKAISSMNATKIGLYTARDFILTGEEDEYISGFNDLMAELAPQTPMEKVFATEIMSANRRLRRCRVIEADLALQPERDEKTQRSVDRARAQAHVIVRRSMNELRTLQTERAIRKHIKLPGIAGLADTARVLKVVDFEEDAQSPASQPEEARAEPGSFCKSTSNTPIRVTKTPRNAPCPCRSGLKYKKCCGNPAREALKPAA